MNVYRDTETNHQNLRDNEQKNNPNKRTPPKRQASNFWH